MYKFTSHQQYKGFLYSAFLPILIFWRYNNSSSTRWSLVALCSFECISLLFKWCWESFSHTCWPFVSFFFSANCLFRSFAYHFHQDIWFLLSSMLLIFTFFVHHELSFDVKYRQLEPVNYLPCLHWFRGTFEIKYYMVFIL